MEARQRLLLTSSLGDSRVYRAHGNTPISPISSQCTVIAVYSNYCMLVWTNDRTLHDWQAVADSGWLLICRRRHGLFVKCTFIHSTHTHTHPFNGPLSGTTRVSRYQKGKTNLDFTEARDSEWQRNQLGHMQICTSLQTNNHASTPPLSFYRPDALPATQPTVSKHWRLHALNMDI